MASGSRRNRDVDRLVQAVAMPQREVVIALRNFILEIGPGLREEAKWGAPCYRGTRFVCSIAAHSDHTNLEFFRGASLSDPKGLLEGTGKSLRHVKLHTVGDVKPSHLGPLLREAIALDSA